MVSSNQVREKIIATEEKLEELNEAVKSTKGEIKALEKNWNSPKLLKPRLSFFRLASSVEK